MLKKLLMISAVFFALVVSAIFLIPVFYDVDTKLKPTIVKTIEENLNAKAEIGHLSLGLWGKIIVEIDSLSLTETSGQTKVFDVEGASLEIPFLSLLSGRLEVTFKAESPKIYLISGTDGKLNVLKMVKTVGEKQTPAPSGSTSSSGTDIGSRMYFTSIFSGASIEYKDEKSETTSAVTGLDLKVVNVGINHPFEIEGKANLDVKSAGAVLSGPFELKGQSEVRMGAVGFESFALKANADLNDVAITYGNLFKKTENQKLNLETDLIVFPDRTEIRSADLIINDLKIGSVGTVRTSPSVEFDIKVKSSKLRLEHWKNVIALAGEYGLQGAAGFDISLKGTPEKFQYSGGLELREGVANVPGLTVPATAMNLDLDLVTDRVQIKRAGMRLGSSDLSFSGTLDNFLAPKIRLDVRSKLMNLDELLPRASSAEQSNAPTSGDADGAPTEDVSFEGPVAKIKKSPTMKKLDFLGRAQISKLVIKKAELTNFDSEIEFKNLILNLRKASLKAFGGAVDMTLSTDFNEKSPSYKMAGSVSGLDINAAITNQFPDLKDSLKGLANSKMSISGSGARLSEVKKNLRGSGDLNIANGSWSALAGLKMLAEKMSSIPGAKEKIGTAIVEDKFKTAKSNFSIKDSRIYIEKAEADMEGSRTTLFMNGWASFEKTLYLKGDIHLPIPNPPSDLRTADGRAKLPFEAEGPLMSPNIKWDETTKVLAAAYLKDEGAKAVNQELKKLKENVKDENVKKLLDQVDEKKVNELLKGIKF